MVVQSQQVDTSKMNDIHLQIRLQLTVSNILVDQRSIFISIFCRYAAISVASKLSDMQLGESVDIGQLTKKEQKKARYTKACTTACFYQSSRRVVCGSLFTLCK